MKIRITDKNVFSQFGAFVRGDTLETPKYTEAFLIHLAKQVGCAEFIETKVINPVVENKSATPKNTPAKKKTVKQKKPS